MVFDGVEFFQASAVTSATPPGVRWIVCRACSAVWTVRAPGALGAGAVDATGLAAVRAATLRLGREAGWAWRGLRGGSARGCAGASTVTAGSDVEGAARDAAVPAATSVAADASMA